MAIEKWQITESSWVFESPFLRVRQDRCRMPDGRVVPEYFLVETQDFAMVVALTPREELILVKQYKHGSGQVIYELPAGYLAPQERPEECALRELREETGYRAKSLIRLASLYVVPGFMSCKGHFFLADQATLESAPSTDEHEEIEVELVPFQAAIEGIRARELGLLVDTNSVLAILLAGEVKGIGGGGKALKASLLTGI